MATSRETLVIEVRADGSRVVTRQIEEIGRVSRGSVDNLYLLKRALRTIGVGVAAHELARLSDAYTNIQNRLSNVTKDTTELSAVMDELYRVSRETRSSFETNAELFNRMALATRNLGLSQREVIDITELLNKAVITSGASVRESNNAIIQLSQGLSSGRLAGDELRSVLEQLPVVADLIAKEMSRMGRFGDVVRGDLRKLGREGKITPDIIVKAFQNAREEIEGKFAKTIPTISQSFTVLRSATVRWIGEFNKATGASEYLSKAIMWVADNMETLGKVSGIAAAVGSFYALASAIGTATKALRLLTFAALANPFTALATAIVAATSALYFFGDDVQAVRGEMTTLGDLGRAAFEEIELGAVGLMDHLSAMSPVINQLWEELKNFNWSEELIQFGKDIDTLVANTRGEIFAIKAMFDWLVENIGYLPDALADLFREGMDRAKDWVDSGLYNIATAFNQFFKIGLEIPNRVSLDKGDRLASAFEDGPAQSLAQAVQEAMQRGVELGGIGAEDEMRKIVARAEEIARDRKEQAGAYREFADLNVPGVKIDRPEEIDEKAAKRRQKELEKAMKLLEKQLKARLEVNREFERELQLLQLTSRERQIQQRIFEVEDKLREAGVRLTEEEINLIERKIRALEDLDKISKDIGQGVDLVVGSMREGIRELITEGRLDFKEFFADIAADFAIFLMEKLTFEPLAENLSAALTKVFAKDAIDAINPTITVEADPMSSASSPVSAEISTAAASITSAGDELASAAPPLAAATRSLSDAGDIVSEVLTESGADLVASGDALTSAGAAVEASVDDMDWNSILMEGVDNVAYAGDVMVSAGGTITQAARSVVAGGGELSTAAGKLVAGVSTLDPVANNMGRSAAAFTSAASRMEDAALGSGRLFGGLATPDSELPLKLGDAASSLYDSGQALTNGVSSLDNVAQTLGASASAFDNVAQNLSGAGGALGAGRLPGGLVTPDPSLISSPATAALDTSAARIAAASMSLTTSTTALGTTATTLANSGASLTAGVSTLAPAGEAITSSAGYLSTAGNTLSASGNSLAASGSTLTASGSSLTAGASSLAGSSTLLGTSSTTLAASSATLPPAATTLTTSGGALTSSAGALTTAAGTLSTGAAVGGGGGGGFLGALFNGFTGSLSGLAKGGSFDVGGRGGVDNNLVAFKATRGENVTVTPAGKKTGGSPTQVNVYSYGQQAEVNQRKGQNGEDIVDVFIGRSKDSTAADIRRGGTDINRAMEDRYGLNPARGLR